MSPEDLKTRRQEHFLQALASKDVSESGDVDPQWIAWAKRLGKTHGEPAWYDKNLKEVIEWWTQSPHALKHEKVGVEECAWHPKSVNAKEIQEAIAGWSHDLEPSAAFDERGINDLYIRLFYHTVLCQRGYLNKIANSIDAFQSDIAKSLHMDKPAEVEEKCLSAYKTLGEAGLEEAAKFLRRIAKPGEHIVEGDYAYAYGDAILDAKGLFLYVKALITTNDTYCRNLTRQLGALENLAVTQRNVELWLDDFGLALSGHLALIVLTTSITFCICCLFDERFSRIQPGHENFQLNQEQIQLQYRKDVNKISVHTYSLTLALKILFSARSRLEELNRLGSSLKDDAWWKSQTDENRKLWASEARKMILTHSPGLENVQNTLKEAGASQETLTLFLNYVHLSINVQSLKQAEQSAREELAVALSGLQEVIGNVEKAPINWEKSPRMEDRVNIVFNWTRKELIGTLISLIRTIGSMFGSSRDEQDTNAALPYLEKTNVLIPLSRVFPFSWVFSREPVVQYFDSHNNLWSTYLTSKEDLKSWSEARFMETHKNKKEQLEAIYENIKNREKYLRPQYSAENEEQKKEASTAEKRRDEVFFKRDIELHLGTGVHLGIGSVLEEKEKLMNLHKFTSTIAETSFRYLILTESIIGTLITTLQAEAVNEILNQDQVANMKALLRIEAAPGEVNLDAKESISKQLLKKQISEREKAAEKAPSTAKKYLKAAATTPKFLVPAAVALGGSLLPQFHPPERVIRSVELPIDQQTFGRDVHAIWKLRERALRKGNPP